MTTSYFEDGNASITDTRLIAKHLTGKQLLINSDLGKADLDQDGHISAYDLHLMLRLALNDIHTPITSPRIMKLPPLVVRPGQRLSILGENLGTDADAISAFCANENVFFEVDVELQGESSFNLDLPTDIHLPEEVINVKLYVIRGGIRSNFVPLEITSRPILESIEPCFANTGDLITLRGPGLGTGVDSIRVFFNDSSFSPISTAENELVVEVPEGISGNVSVSVENNLGRSNSVELLEAIELTGTFNLPVNTSLQIDELRLASGGLETTPSPNGEFSLQAPLSEYYVVEVLDSEQDAILGAVLIDEINDIQIDEFSTALWMIFNLCGGTLLNHNDITYLNDRLQNSTELESLAIKISERHAINPQVWLIPSNDIDLRAAVDLVRESTT